MVNTLKPITKEALYHLLYARFDGYSERLNDIPSPELLHDSMKAAKRIAKAVKNKERIHIVGDYDVDGVTATALSLDFFEHINYSIDSTIPNRFKDGYGISPKIMERIDADLIITVDNGINALEAAQICKERGIDLIITDHHTPGDILPDAYAIVNPKHPKCSYPFKEICGAQVAWLLWALVKKELHLDINMSQYLDLLSLAVIADVMPLIGMNRAMVKSGLKHIAHSQRPAMQAFMMQTHKTSLTSEDISFQLAPRINSAGRMEDAMFALNFLRSRTLDEALKSLETLTQLNNYRKDIEAQATQEAYEQVNLDDTIIVVAAPSWHEGVVGIVASRLVDRFKKPAIVLSIEGERAKGSARSIGSVNIFELISASSIYLEKFGGHMMAAGLGLKTQNIQAFKAHINQEAQKIPKKDFIEHNSILGILEPDDVSFELLELIESFEPYGEGNPRPKFLFKNINAQYVKRMGNESQHLRFNIAHKDEPYGLSVVAFNYDKTLQNNALIDMSFTLNRNVYGGKTTIQLMLDRIYE